MWRASLPAAAAAAPQAFRDDVAEEMLWIFDQEVATRKPYRLLADAALSLLRQHWRAPEPLAWRPLPDGAPGFTLLGGGTLGGAPRLAGGVAALVLLLIGFAAIVRHGGYPGLLRIPTIYSYAPPGPIDLTIDWRRLLALDVDGDGWISPTEREQPDARRWEPLFSAAAADDGLVSLAELKLLLLRGQIR